MTYSKDTALVLSLTEVTSTDTHLVGGKNSSLGEMIKNLQGTSGIQVPLGFATTIYAYKKFFTETGLDHKLSQLLVGLNINDTVNLTDISRLARNLVLNTPFPVDLEKEITAWYANLSEQYGDDTSVAVRSSASKEDMPDASFAGQLETFLNVSGIGNVIEEVHRCMASCFTARNISYLVGRNYNPVEVAVSVGVQKMVRSDLACAGVCMSIDTESGFRDTVLITGSYGFGEAVVQGVVNPDEFQVFKPTVKNGYSPIIHKVLGSKRKKMIPVLQPNNTYRSEFVATEYSERHKYVLTNEEVIQLAKSVAAIEEHYSRIRGEYTPMDVEWAKDGVTGNIFIVQARPITTEIQEVKVSKIITYKLTDEKSKCIVNGTAVGNRIGSGRVSIILNEEHMDRFQDGDVLVTEKTDPDWEPIMKKASAIVTNAGGRTCHAAIIAREMNLPAIVGCGNATSLVSQGDNITVVCSEGEEGAVYEGLLEFDRIETPVDNIPITKTKILMNVGNPEEAYSARQYPVDGVGLARLEFIVANSIKVHPLALLNYDSLNPELQEKIDKITTPYHDKREYFVALLKRGIAKIASAFYPSPVVVRMSDFKSNEYAKLLGGEQYEPNEENPMIGWRGASRYYSDTFREAFNLECEAYRIVRNEMGLTNVIPMIPFCRTIEEAQKVLSIMSDNGLIRGVNDLSVYMMVEVPSNVWMIEEFSELFDGFSIGSNDLTQLTLGLDRDSELVNNLYDERNLAVLRAIKYVITMAKSKQRKIGICGQAPSDYPEFCKFLIECGIDSISLNQDTVISTRISVAQFEHELMVSKV